MDRTGAVCSEFVRDERPACGFKYCAGAVEIKALAVFSQRFESGDPFLGFVQE
jgi:hypothetical protein